MLAFSLFYLLASTLFSTAAPVPRATTVTTLSTAEVSSFVPFTQLARAAYCEPTKIIGWKCGAACEAVPDFEPVLTGGDGNEIQFFFVGYWPSANSVVVSHQGTDPTQLMSVLTDLNVPLSAPSSSLFPGLPSDVAVHTGFREQHEISAEAILQTVKDIIGDKGADRVTLIGHSLGGALAELDALYMRLNLPASISVNAVTYGTPRVGNAEWAKVFDDNVTDFKRINNDNDPVPIIPGRFLSFVHPKGEIHLLEDLGQAVACAGNDNDKDDDCTIKTVPNVLFGNVLDHLEYEGIPVGSLFCT